MKHLSPTTLSQETPQVTKTTSRFRVVLEGIGWLSFSIVFNVLNTIVFAALYPKILEHITPDKKSYSTAFSIINTVTTLLSAIALPTYGSLVDCLNWIKPSLITTQYVGILATGALFFLGKLPSSGDWAKAHLYINEALYVVAMFFLRVAVMNNNALLPCFPKHHITVLSLLSNFIGYTVNLFGLLILILIPHWIPDNIWDITNENWWLLIFTSFTVIVSIFTFLSPSGIEKPVETTEETQSLISDAEQKDSNKSLKERLMVLKRSFTNIWDTMKMWRRNESYYNCWIFLSAYLFFSTAGTVVTIYLGPLFIDIYNLTLKEEVLLNFYFKLAMVVGIIVGVLFEKMFKVSDVVMIIAHNVLFNILLMLIFVSVSLRVRYIYVLFLFLSVGFLYSWNSSVARGLMGKLIPQDRKSTFMGFYSTFTYLGISIISLLNAILRQLDLPPHMLALILFIWAIPAYLFMMILRLSLSKLPSKSVLSPTEEQQSNELKEEVSMNINN